MQLNNDIKYILNKINENNFESFVVGGCVRDYLMGTKPKDYDITTSAKPYEIKELFDKTIDTGIEHGTVTVVVNKENYEVTTYRIDGEYEDNRKPKEVFFTEDIVKDLERRDFTINAIAYNDYKKFVDPFLGRDDIQKKLIRGVGNPTIRFQEDALRMFRAIRFSIQLGFDIEKDTYNSILTENKLVKNLSVERVRDEFSKMLLGEHLKNFPLVIDTKLFYYYKKDFHDYLKNNLNFIKNTLHLSNRDYVSRYSILLYNMGCDEARDFLKFLKFNNKTITYVFETIKCLHEIEDDYDDIYTRKLLNKYGFEILNYTISIKQQCFNKNYDKMNLYIKEVIDNDYAIHIKNLKITGNDLKQLGITNGLDIGNTLKMLLTAVLENPSINNKEDLLKLAKDNLS